MGPGLALGLGLGGGALLGGLGGLFGSKSKSKPVYVNPQFNEVAERFATQQLPALQAANAPALASYESAIASSAPLRRAMAEEGVSLLGGPLRAAATYDPLDTRNRMLEGTLGSVRSFFPDLIGSVNRVVADRNRVLGIGGRPTSIYGNTLLAKSFGESLAPILGGIYANAGRDAASIEAARINNLLATLQLLEARGSLPLRAAAEELLPAQARGAEFAERIGALGTIGNALKANLAGYNVQENPIGAFLGGAGRGLGLGALTLGALGGFGGLGAGAGAAGGASTAAASAVPRASGLALRAGGLGLGGSI